MLTPSKERNPSELSYTVCVSPILETLFSMRCLLTAWMNDPWVVEARETMGSAFLTELGETFGPFRNGLDLFEVALATPEGSVEGFLERLNTMSADEFTYYAFGQIVPRGEEIASLDPSTIKAYFEYYGDYEHYLAMYQDLSASLPGESWAEYAERLKVSFKSLVERFWKSYMERRIETLLIRSREGVVVNESYAKEHGALALYKVATGHAEFPPMVPEGAALERIDFVIVVHASTWSSNYVAHGVQTCVVRDDRTPARVAALEERERRVMAVAKALSDKTRFSMLKMIYQHEGVLNGANIAAKTGLTKSVVSKHLRQLIDAGLIRETSNDNRNNLYFANREVITRLSGETEQLLGGTRFD